jgi:hypothetical protein
MRNVRPKGRAFFKAVTQEDIEPYVVGELSVLITGVG